jgi:signal transduction histidine kinase
MNKWLLSRLGHHYLLLTLFASRIFGAVGGLLVMFYVELALEMSPTVRTHFRIACLVVVAVAIALTLLMAMWETRHLRPALRATLQGKGVDPQQGTEAVREAFIFATRHHRNEAWMVPLSTGVPVLIFLKVVDNAPNVVLVNIALAVFMAVSLALMSHFFAVEYFMAPVIRHLLDCGITIPYKTLPPGRLHVRFGLCFSLITITTALMIGTLARQRATDIVEGRLEQQQALHSLIAHSTYITIAAAVIGIVLSIVLTHPVLSRVGRLVTAMERVGGGDMSERLWPTGNDEIDTLARQFNSMVEEIDKRNSTIVYLNTNLERKVHERTALLETNVRKLRETQAQLIQAEKMKSLGQLVAGVAHELNNSINAVYNGIQPLRSKLNQLEPLVQKMLAAQPADDRPLCERVLRSFASVCQLATVIESGATRTARIVSDLKTFSHPGREEMAPFDVNDVLEMSLNLLSNETRNRIGVHKHYAQLERIIGPRNQISQVLLNILNNAQQAISGQGDIHITTCREGDAVCVRIRDTGPGIPEHLQQRIFDPFFTTKEPGVGTGLGLSISYGIIKTLGGNIECRSRPGEGAEFIVRLPCSPPQEPDALAPAVVTA